MFAACYILESNRNRGKMELLTRLEEAILIAVLKLKDNAYGVPINPGKFPRSLAKITPWEGSILPWINSFARNI